MLRYEAAMPRILLLLFMLSLMTMLFIARCGLNIDAQLKPQQSGLPTLQLPLRDYQMELLKHQEDVYKKEISMLEAKIMELKNELRTARTSANHTSTQMQREKEKQEWQKRKDEKLKTRALFYDNFFKMKGMNAEILRGIPLKTEYELVPFCRFTINRIYLVEPGLGKRVVEKPIGYKKKDLLEVIAHGVSLLNRGKHDPSGRHTYNTDDFIEGIYRTEPTMGSHYELYFKDKDNPSTTSYTKIILTRPYGPLQHIVTNHINTKSEIINLILPLSGRTETFKHFMEVYTRVCIRQDKRVHLTVVYFGTEGLNEVKTTLGKISKMYRYKDIKLITLNEKFSRGRGLQIGAQSWTKGDVLMFLCDVDIVFSLDFLERCRLNAEKKTKVYYPMVFSLYNPKDVYLLQDVSIPPEREMLVISKDTGFWRDFGYGMTCQYRSDFMEIKGFDEQITGWGMEDVYLYRKYVKSNLMVVRATDPGIFHLWHPKHCDPKLSPDQYKGCIRSKALNEASHAQLGLLAFKDEVDIHRDHIKKKHTLV